MYAAHVVHLALLGVGATGLLMAAWRLLVPALLRPDLVAAPDPVLAGSLAGGANALAILLIAFRARGGRRPASLPVEAGFTIGVAGALSAVVLFGTHGYATLAAIGCAIVMVPAVGGAIVHLFPEPASGRGFRLSTLIAGTVVLLAAGGWCVFLAAVVVHADPGPARREFVLAIVLLAVGVIGSAWLLAWVLGRNVRRDLRELEAAVRGLDTPPASAARLTAPLDDDELAALARAVETLRNRLWRELDEYDEALRRSRGADVAREEFLRVVSHELRTPLAAICGYAQLLLEEIEGPLAPEAADDVQSILDSGRQLSALVDDVVDVAMLSSGRPALKLDTVDLAKVINEVVRTHESLIRGRPITLDVTVADDLPALFADRKRLRQVVTNLVANAIKFTDEGHVRIAARRRPDAAGVEVEIVDTGVGISEEELPGLFDEYKQGSNVDSRRRKGAGLGLAICRRLIELHGGEITASSRPGEGSRFVFRLPAAEPSAAAKIVAAMHR